MRLAPTFLLLACLAPAALAQTAPAPEDAALQAARAKSCAAFLTEVNQHTAAGGDRGETPSFALVWGALLKADANGLGKIGQGSLMFDNTLFACQRIRGRTLGATMDAEFAAL